MQPVSLDIGPKRQQYLFRPVQDANRYPDDRRIERHRHFVPGDPDNEVPTDEPEKEVRGELAVWAASTTVRILSLARIIY